MWRLFLLINILLYMRNNKKIFAQVRENLRKNQLWDKVLGAWDEYNKYWDLDWAPEDGVTNRYMSLKEMYEDLGEDFASCVLGFDESLTLTERQQIISTVINFCLEDELAEAKHYTRVRKDKLVCVLHDVPESECALNIAKELGYTKAHYARKTCGTDDWLVYEAVNTWEEVKK